MQTDTLFRYASMILGLFSFAIEGWIARHYHSFDPSLPYSRRVFDRYYYWFVFTAIFLSFFFANLFARMFHIGSIPLMYAVPMGVLFFVVGYGLRIYAIRHLKSAFSVVLRVEKDQKLVRSGPYKYIRHPSYTGSLLASIGFAIASGLPLAIVLVALSVLFLQLKRIYSEEAILTTHFPEYLQYREQTKMLIPFVL